MKRTFKLLVMLTLILSLVFSSTSCDLLIEYGVDLDGLFGSDNGDDSTDTPSDNTDGTDDKEEGTDIPHTHNYKPTSVAATCTEKGTITYMCECGKSFVTDIPAKGHAFLGAVCTSCGYVDPDYKEDEPPKDDTDGEIFEGGILYLPNEDDPVTSDPYINVNVTEFYANYTPAISYMDAYYRTQHNLMSGSIASQSATPTVSSHQPTLDGKLVRNTTYLFSEDGKTYYVVDAYGNIVNEIYKCGAYVTLEEVAAYVFAFGTFPANHTAAKKGYPSSDPWGKYLRLNHTNFTGDTSKYPYEPELPNITGCGGDLYYYEMDIGAAGYNNGSKITRGSCRIVYTRNDLDRDGVIEINETYLFYTQNHYHDFREYLNYEGGWGTLFGDEAGGGISRPTQYPETSYYSFVYRDGTPITKITRVVVVCMPKREEI